MNRDKILIIDDDEKIQFAFHSLMEKEGFEGVKATNGSAALDLIKSNHFTAIFLDLALPDMDGLKILELIRNIDKIIPVIIISSMVTSQGTKEFQKLGIAEFLEKPLSLYKIREILHKIVSHQK